MLWDILAFLGWALLAIVAVVGSVVIYLLYRLWRGVKKASRNFNPFYSAPAHLTLRIPDNQRLRPPREWKALRAAGYRYRGCLRLEVGMYGMGYIRLILFLAPENRGLLIRAETGAGDNWWQAHLMGRDKRLHTWINCQSERTAFWTPGKEKVHWAGGDLEALTSALRREQEGAAPLPSELPQLRRWLAGHYLFHRLGLYLTTPDRTTLRHMLDDDEIDDDSIEPLMKQYAEIRDLKLSQLVTCLYVYLANSSAGAWSLHRAESFVVHERMTWARAAEVLPEALRPGSGEEALSGTDLLQRLHQLNEGLPQDQRLQVLARYEQPFAATLFAPAS